MLLVGNVVVLFSRFVAIFGQKYGSSNIGCIVFLTRNQMDTKYFQDCEQFFYREYSKNITMCDLNIKHCVGLEWFK